MLICYFSVYNSARMLYPVLCVHVHSVVENLGTQYHVSILRFACILLNGISQINGEQLETDWLSDDPQFPGQFWSQGTLKSKLVCEILAERMMIVNGRFLPTRIASSWR